MRAIDADRLLSDMEAGCVPIHVKINDGLSIAEYISDAPTIKSEKLISREELAGRMLRIPCYVEILDETCNRLFPAMLDRDSNEWFDRNGAFRGERSLYLKTWRAWRDYPTRRERMTPWEDMPTKKTEEERKSMEVLTTTEIWLHGCQRYTVQTFIKGKNDYVTVVFDTEEVEHFECRGYEEDALMQHDGVVKSYYAGRTGKGETATGDEHKAICEVLNLLYVQKNHDYGDSFHKTWQEDGFAMARVRLGDKMERFKRLSKEPDSQQVKGESIRDTLLDLANYAIMTVMEIDRDKKQEQTGE